MSTFNRARRGLLTIAAVSAAALAIGASPAAAAVHWSDTSHGMHISGTLTVYKNGSSAKTCTVAPGTLEGEESSLEGSEFDVHFIFTYWIRFTCSGGGYFDMNFLGSGGSNGAGGYSVSLYGAEFLENSPWGYEWGQDGPRGIKFVNGSGLTPSKMTFSSTKLGILWSPLHETVSATGNLNVTTASGGLLTLQP